MNRAAPLIAAATLLAAPALTQAQAARSVGVVTTIAGHATVARATLPQPVPLNFKDDVFERDRISTAEKSIVRVLLGGKAVVTVRELSQLTITEDADRSTLDLASGKVGLAVQRPRMRPGESIEIRTPNAVASVRGTVLVVEVIRASVQRGAPSGGALTLVGVLSGSSVVTLPTGQQFTLFAGQSLNTNTGVIGPLPSNLLAGLGLTARPHQGPPGNFQQTLVQNEAARLANTAVQGSVEGQPFDAGAQGGPSLITPPLLSITGENIQPPPAPQPQKTCSPPSECQRRQ
jgi:hypothetical protein